MREVELKSVVDDVDACRRRLEDAGANLVYSGRLEDRRYDSAERRLAATDYVLRTRVYRGPAGIRAELGWKGPTMYQDGYKIREELGTPVADPDSLATILEHVGFVVTRAIDREIAQYELGGTVVRFERYPRMDPLVEVEGTPDGIEHAIVVLGLPRAGFTSDRLPAFVRRFQERTGETAALCDSELDGTTSYSIDDA